MKNSVVPKLTKVVKSPKRPAVRDLNAELVASIVGAKAGKWGRKTEFTRHADGAWRRRVVLSDGTVDKDEIIRAVRSAQ